MDILEAARLLRFQTDWERRFHHYNLLLEAGLSADEAAQIADLEVADHAEISRERIAA